jgi:LmbE family N-acetylglucosaminyl deacetylase
MNDPFAGPRPLRLDRLDLPRAWRVLALAPHPDDFESTAVAHRWFRDRGNPIGLLVLSSSANGVEDSFCDPPTPEAKAAVREEEQRAGLRMFGLGEDRMRLQRLRVAWPGGYIVDDERNYAAFERAAAELGWDLAVLPHGDDSNPDHRLTYRWWRRLAASAGRPTAALLFRDPKTIEMREDIALPFDAETAAWKAGLLRCHRSQHERNLRTRGHGFDERILRGDRAAAARLGFGEPYAETFELARPTPSS